MGMYTGEFVIKSAGTANHYRRLLTSLVFTVKQLITAHIKATILYMLN